MGSGYRLGSKLTNQSKMKPLSDPQLSHTSTVQVPLSGQPSSSVHGWADSYVPLGKVPPALSAQVPLVASGDQK